MNLLANFYDDVFCITFNRQDKSNAFDDQFLLELQALLDQAIADTNVRVIIINAKGKYFSSGADIAWMQKVITYSENENFNDAMILANFLFTLYNCPKPTIALIQGPAYGGGAGLITACDIRIASLDAGFCFSEVKLGLIPAVISPYVVEAIGPQTAKFLFLTAEFIDAAKAKELNLIQACVKKEELWDYGLKLAKNISKYPPQALTMIKELIPKITAKPIDPMLIQQTAELIAKKRISAESQLGLKAFLAKTRPNWN